MQFSGARRRDEQNESPQHHFRAGAIFALSDNEDEKKPLDAPRQFQQLTADVEELLARLDDEHGPQLGELRARVEETLSQAQAALAKQGKTAAAQVRHYAGMADDYISGYSRTAFASGILIGAAFGFLVASARSSD
jgi:ElaB/YqjD/DUF883 family membrane-anchored ribosome-binding protein